MMNWPLVGELLVRSGVILAGGELVRLLCFRSGPKVRFRIRLLTISLLAALPLFASLLPAIYIPWWNSAQNAAHVTVSETIHLPGAAQASLSVPWLLIVWVAGFAMALVPTIAGVFTIGRIRRNAKAFAGPGWPRLLEELSVSAAVRKVPGLRHSDELQAPITAGIFRPQILLPAGSEEWTECRRQAVLLHELAHIRRRDVAIQLFVQVVAALWWFQPLVWVLRRGIRQDSELACDAEVMTAGMRPSVYADVLLATAKDMGRSAHAVGAAIGMARRGDLEGRLTAILNPPAIAGSSRRALIAAAALIGIAGVASATSFHLHQDFEGGLAMKRTVMAGLLASVGLSAATVSGTLTDITGGAIPNAKIVLYSPDTGMKQEAVSGSDGKFTLDNAPAGDAILRIEKPGFSSVFREFNLNTDTNIQRDLTMQVGPIQQQMTVSGQGTPQHQVTRLSPDRLRIGGTVEESHIIAKKMPAYPAAAKAAGIQGKVLLEAMISKEGVPQELRVLSSPSDDLSESALEAVRQWRYSPTLLNGNPVEVLTDIVINYTLSQ
ncbi:MAG TPA: M56 family metallopeptidase [Bryobacteraceae bacterium]|nr:M56 family metallopeptidase [Bryobacteraceae bacterium]